LADPVTMMAGVGLAGSIGSSVMGGVGANYAAKAKAGQYNYQAGIARVNQRVQEQNADFASQSGEIEGVQTGLKHRALLGKIKATQGASGIDVNSGTNLDVYAGAQTIARMDQENVARNAMQKVRAYKSAAWSEGEQANLYDVAARNATKEGKIGVLSSIVGGASSVSSKWLQGNQAGVWG
jgi:hypothetical protein